MITVVTSLGVNNEITPELIRESVKQLKSERRTLPILQDPPTDTVADGYYYAEVVDWNLDNKEVEIDFVTVSEDVYKAAFDILMSNISSLTPRSHIWFDNQVTRVRKFKLNDSLYNKLMLEYKDYGSSILEKNSYNLIHIKNGEIDYIFRVSYAG